MKYRIIDWHNLDVTPLRFKSIKEARGWIYELYGDEEDFIRAFKIVRY